MITITIDAHPDRGSLRDQIDESMEALGFRREQSVPLVGSPLSEIEAVKARLGMGVILSGQAPTEPGAIADEILGTNIMGNAPARERGKPAPGHARRTKAEIAEDEAADRADAARKSGVEIASMTTLPADTPPEKVAEAFANIRTGGERIDPENPDDGGAEDDEETAAQDAADEAAETAAATGGKATLDDVRNALGKYVARFGMAAAQEDGPKVITMVCGDGHVKMSDIPDDPALVARVRDGVLEMLEKNPFQRKAVA